MIYVGTSGFSYEDWKGYFYPEHLDRRNMLSYYAERFNCVEVNSTYYTIPAPSTFAAMDRRTPAGFRFAVKAHQEMTHAESADKSVFDAFLRSIGPVKESGKLGCVLAQFPWSFRNTRENMDRLRELKDRMRDIPTAIEFRNAGWITDETFDLLRELDLGFCSVDEPRLKGLMPRVAEATSRVGYVRFHGRNAAKWWKHEQAHERYDYLYTEEELAEWVPRVREIESKTEETYIFFNNHFQGKSAQNARMFARMLNLTLPIDSLTADIVQESFGNDF
ncbi:MAG: DUF72 domain-containing protein [Armatimonadota bacterium]